MVRSDGWTLQGCGKKCSDEVIAALPHGCLEHNTLVYSHGTLNGRKVWTSLYKRPKKRDSGCYFLAINKLSKNKRFLVVRFLVHCSQCKVLFIIGQEMLATQYQYMGIVISNTFLTQPSADNVLSNCSDFNWCPAYFIRVDEKRIFSVDQEIKLSD